MREGNQKAESHSMEKSQQGQKAHTHSRYVFGEGELRLGFFGRWLEHQQAHPIGKCTNLDTTQKGGVTELGGDSGPSTPRGQLIGLYSLELDESTNLSLSVKCYIT
jgi:hypothetical protein